MSCVLRLTSTEGDLASWIARSRLPIDQSHRRGELRTGRWRGRAYADSGFSCVVSECGGDDLPGQVADTVRFLREHGAELRELRAGSQVDDLRLDFSVWQRTGVAAVTQSDYFPPELLKLAGDLGIGIEVSLYPVSSEESKP